MRRRGLLLACGVVAVGAVAVGAIVVASAADEASVAPAEHTVNTARVERGKLASIVSLDGTLTYRARPDGSPWTAINGAAGTYTELPATGTKVGCGEVFYRVDDDPVLLLCGAVPAYRDLGEGDRGQDVRQLNRSLHRLGYDADAGVSVDPDENDFTWETEAALRELQERRGMNDNGELGVGDAVFLPGQVRVAKVVGELARPASPGAVVAEATSDTLEIQLALDASQRGVVDRGDDARITLPGNVSAEGEVTRVGRVAQAPSDQDEVAAATVPAFVSLDEPRLASGLDRAPVQVEIETKGAKDVLNVPTLALVGRAGGGFAVEVVREGGGGELVAVELGLFDTTTGRVEVEGDLREGDEVVVPGT